MALLDRQGQLDNQHVAFGGGRGGTTEDGGGSHGRLGWSQRRADVGDDESTHAGPASQVTHVLRRVVHLRLARLVHIRLTQQYVGLLGLLGQYVEC